MDYSERNKKVAIARWKKVHYRERMRISDNSDAKRYKAALCGFLAGDGNVAIRKEIRHYAVRFYPDDEWMLTEYLRALEYIYGKQPSITIEDNVFHVKITSFILTGDIAKYAPLGTKTWDLPYSLGVL